MADRKTKTSILSRAQDSIARPFNTAHTVTNAKNSFVEAAKSSAPGTPSLSVEKGKAQSQ